MSALSYTQRLSFPGIDENNLSATYVAARNQEALTGKGLIAPEEQHIYSSMSLMYPLH